MQGTKQYFDDIVKNMSDKDLADELEFALRNDMLNYLMIHQKFDNLGNLKPTEISKFNIK